MNGPDFKKGCPGAVYSNGSPSKDYCMNTGSANDRFGWWGACCKWKENQCLPIAENPIIPDYPIADKRKKRGVLGK